MASLERAHYLDPMRENNGRSIDGTGTRLESRETSQRLIFLEILKRQPRLLLNKFQVIRCAMTHPGVPWYARLVAALSVCYVFSPIQLIPSFIPVIGQLDDALVVTLGFKALTRWVSPDVLAQWNEKPKAHGGGWHRPKLIPNQYCDAAPGE